MELERAWAIVRKNYVFERIAKSATETMRDPSVKPLVANFLRWHPDMREKISAGTLTLSELLGILDTFSEGEKLKLDNWLRAKMGKTTVEVVADAKNFEAKLPEGAEAVRTVVLHDIDTVFR